MLSLCSGCADVGQIVYLINPHVGHLGIFVSASVARLEHRAILESLDEIETLEPGLCEMKIDNPTGDPDCLKPAYSVSFEPRDVSDIGEVHPVDALRNVAQISRTSDAAYDLFLGPWIRAITTPQSAETLRSSHPMRWSRLMFSTRYNPWMGAVQALADSIRPDRAPLPDDNPQLRAEREAIERIGAGLGAMRLARDHAIAVLFKALYAPGAAFVKPEKE